MNIKKENPKITKVEEPSVVYESSKIKFKGIDRTTFDFDEEVKMVILLKNLKQKCIKE